MYDNGTCLSPEEIWTCGLGNEPQACQWYEGALTTVGSTAVIALEETFGIIGQGVLGLSSWVLTQVVNRLSPLWPIILTCFGIIALVIITVATFKAGAVAAVKKLFVSGRAEDRRLLSKNKTKGRLL